MEPASALLIDRMLALLAEARAVLACFGVDRPALIARIEAAMDEAHALKRGVDLPSFD